MRQNHHLAIQLKRTISRVRWFVFALIAFGTMAGNQGVSGCIGQICKSQDKIINDDKIGLRSKVSVLIDEKTNTITIVGLEEDVAKVKRVILDTKRKLQAGTGIVSARISVAYQQAEAVAQILRNSMRADEIQNSDLQIHAVHFPEGIWLSGSASAVKRAKALIATIDFYED